MRGWHWIAVASGLFFIWAAYGLERTKQDWYADHVLRRVETDPEFRERLRAALGVEP